MRPHLIPLAACLVSVVHAAIDVGNLTDDGEHLIYRNPISNPDEIHAVDIDGDTDLDILALGDANQVDTIIWLENTGLDSGVFGPAKFIDHTHETRSIFAADLDGDTDLDIVACSTGFDDRIFWFENTDGAGTFGERQIIANSGNNSLIRAADLDRDGDNDIFWNRFSSGGVYWAANDGSGNFGAANLLVATTAEGLDAADLDGDGDNEIIASHGGFPASVVYYNNTTPPGTPGTGSFSGTATPIGGINNAGPVVAADIDGINGPDVVAASGYDSGFGEPTGVVWFENNGSGGFAAAQNVASAADGPVGITVANLDGDGDLDVLYADEFYLELAWAENTDGAGTFGAPTVISSSFDYLRCCAAGNLDGDTDVDVLYGTWDAEIGWFENSPGGFSTRHALTDGLAIISSMALGDVDGDGHLDLLGSSFDDSSVFLFAGNVGNAFGPLEVLNDTLSEVSDVIAADLDGVNGTDLVVALTGDALAPDPDQFLFLPNDGSNQFTTSSVLDGPPSDAPWSATAADIDNDTDLDLVLAWSGSDEVKWIKNNGGGSFSAPMTLGTSDGCRSVAAGNLDGVPGLEIVAGGWVDGDVILFTNDGTGSLDTFDAGTTVADLSSGAEGIRLVDMDGDTDLDIFFLKTSGTGGPVHWIENTGVNSGTFNPVLNTIDGGGSSLGDAVPVDLDNDGDLDCVTVRGDTNGTIRIYENDGSGGFTLEETFNSGEKTGYRSDYVLGHDVDGDGDQDVIVGSLGQTSFYWYENRFIDGSGDPFTTWASGFGLAADPGLVPNDGDLLTLAEQYAYNLDPTAKDGAVLPEVSPTMGLPRIYFEDRGGDLWLVVEYIRRTTPDSGLTYGPQGGPDLSTWFDVTDNEATSAINADFEHVTVERNAMTAPVYFGRMKLVYSSPGP